MINDPSSDANTLVDHTAQAADKAIKSTQRLANGALDRLSGSVEDARREVAPMLNRAADQTTALAQRSLKAVRETAARASDGTVMYIKDEPLKSMLIAAAAGAALMALFSLLGRSNHRN